MRRICIALVLLLSFIAVFSQTKRLAVIGSSTSACYGFGGPPGDNMNYVNCYINKLVNYYTAQGVNVDLRNDARTGMNVYEAMPTGSPAILINGVSYGPDVARNITHAIAQAPDVILINYPTNAYQYLNVHDVMTYFRTIKKAANDAGKPCFVTTTQPRHDFEFTPAVRLRLMEIRDSILLQFSNFAIDFWTTVAAADGSIVSLYDQGDHVHLNHMGHDFFFQRVRDKNIFSVTLPVKLISFKARCSAEDVIINWSASNELAGTSYAIERSIDGIQFTTQHEMNSRSSAGTNTYQFVDKHPPATLLLYRIRINENGNIFYSAIEKAFAGTAPVTISRIVSGRTDIKITLESRKKETIRVLLRSIAGETILNSTRQVDAGTNQLLIEHRALPPGVYAIQLYGGEIRLLSQSFVHK